MLELKTIKCISNKSNGSKLTRISTNISKEYSNENPLITVLMSVYNTEDEWLMLSIESILHQTYKNIEFIIILDKPTDNSEKIVKSYAETDKRIRIIKNVNNLGITKCLNIGINESSGQFIARMDSDDIAVNTRLDKQLRFMLNNKNISVVGSRVAIFNENNITIGSIKWREDPEEEKIRLLFGNAGISHPTAFFRKSFLVDHNIRYNEKYLKAQDYGMWIDVVKKGGIIHELNDILLIYRTSSTQISTMSRNEQSYYRDMIMSDYLKSNFNLSNTDISIHDDIIKQKYNYNIKEYIYYIDKIRKINKEDNIFNTSLFNKEIDEIWMKFAFKSYNYKLIISKLTIKSILNFKVIFSIFKDKLKRREYNRNLKEFIKNNDSLFV